MSKLKPFRDYSEHEVINLFSFQGSYPTSAGTVVRIVKDNNPVPGSVSDISEISLFDNTLSPLFSTIGTVSKTVNYNDTPAPIGILLKDVREYDENGEYLLHNPRKAAEMDCILPHQAVPVLRRGVVLINGVETIDRGTGGGDPEAGDAIFVGDNGNLATDGLIPVGKFLSGFDKDGYVLAAINF
jgi:hypothetical protein